MNLPRTVLALVAALFVVGTSGCAGSGGGFSDLTSAESTGVELPAGLPANALQGFEVDSARWVGASGDADVWVAHGEEHPICFLTSSGDRWFSACGSGGTYSFGDETYWVIPDGGAVPAEAVPISRNVYRAP